MMQKIIEVFIIYNKYLFVLVLPLTPHLTFAKMPGVKVMHALPIQLVFQIFLATMTFGELFELRAMSSMMLRMVDAHLASLDPIYVLEVVDRLVAECRIERAVRLLLHFVARIPNVRTPTVLMNRFILLCHVDVFNNKRYADLRAYLMKHFCPKALLDFPESGLDPLTEEKRVPHIPENTFQHAKLPEGIDDLGSGGASKDPVGPHHGRPNHFPENKYFEALCLYGYFLYKNGLFESTARIVEFVLKKDPKNYIALWLSGVTCYYYLRDFQAGIRQYMKCIDANPNFSYPYYSLGVLLSDGDYWNPAHALYNKCLLIDPHHHYACLNRVNTHDHDDPGVLQEYERMIKIHPTCVISYREVSRILLRPQVPGGDPTDLDRAENMLLRAIVINPTGDGGEALMDLGNLHLQHRNSQTAREYYDWFIKIAVDRELASAVKNFMQDPLFGQDPLSWQFPGIASYYTSDEEDDEDEEDDDELDD
jgi:tetratricopeptide (TPR) repeat protein